MLDWWFWDRETDDVRPFASREAAMAYMNEPFDQTRRVAEATLSNGYWVSTVFLGLDHGFGGEPQLFETMVFASPARGAEVACRRYATAAQAREGHAQLVEEWVHKPPADPEEEIP